MHEERISSDDGHLHAHGKKEALHFQHEMCFRVEVNKKRGRRQKEKYGHQK